QAEISVRNDAQANGDFTRQLDRLDGNEILNRPERADRSAKDAPEEERKEQRQAEEDQHRDRQRVVRIKQRQGDILDRSDGADAPLLVEAEVKQAENHQPENAAP